MAEEQCSGRMWGVYTEEGPPGELPIALFRTKEDAEGWCEEQEEGGNASAAFYPIMRSDIYVSYWNAPTLPDPKGREFEDFTPSQEH